jgi:phage-related protein (TIGR01555 family)
LITGVLPVIEVVRQAIIHANAGAANAAAMMEEAKVDIIKIPELMSMLQTSDGDKRVMDRFALANTLKGITNTLLLGGDEDFERKQMSFSGLPELIETHLQIASAAADIPMTRLMGQSPAGMNATGESDVRNYYDKLRSHQTTDLSEDLEPLDDIIVRHVTGSRDPKIVYEWNPLWQLSPSEVSAIAQQKAAAVTSYVAANLWAPEELRPAISDMIIADGFLPTLDQHLMGEADFTALLEEQAELQAPAETEQPADKPKPKLRVVGSDEDQGNLFAEFLAENLI